MLNIILIIMALCLILTCMILAFSRKSRETYKNWNGNKIRSLINDVSVEQRGMTYDGSISRIVKYRVGGAELNTLCIMNDAHWFEVYALKESNGETTIKVTPISQNKALKDWYDGDEDELKEALCWGSNEPSAVSFKS